MSTPHGSPIQTRLPFEAQRVRGATGVLGELNERGLLAAADVHVARRLGELAGETDEHVQAAVAFAVRSTREGSVCYNPQSLGGLDPENQYETPADWLERIETSPLTGHGKGLRVWNGQVYLGRHFDEETLLVAALRERAAVFAPPAELGAALERYFPPGPGQDPYAEQREAAAVVAVNATSVITGGPGTGKTTTIARVLGVLLDLEPDLRLGLTAFTGKAATRMTQALAAVVSDPSFPATHRRQLLELSARTLHRTLGARFDNAEEFRYGARQPLPVDVLVVDETSMVPLSLMARVIQALPLGARLVLVGDADQLQSVDAGAVLGDLVAGLSKEGGSTGGELPPEPAPAALVRLRQTHRLKGDIAALAEAVRVADATTAIDILARSDQARLLEDPESDEELWGFPMELRITAGRDLRPTPAVDGAWRRTSAGTRLQALAPSSAADSTQATAALAGASGPTREVLVAMQRHRLLCAHRDGPFGAGHWNRRIERWLVEETGLPAYVDHYAGQPIIITKNDYGTNLFNGDTAVICHDSAAPRGLTAVFDDGALGRVVPLARLGDWSTAHALTVHRSQGSEFMRVSVILPPPDSPLLTRELLYTAITRARESVTLLGSADSVRAAIARPAQRASGLAARMLVPPVH